MSTIPARSRNKLRLPYQLATDKIARFLSGLADVGVLSLNAGYHRLVQTVGKRRKMRTCQYPKRSHHIATK